MKNIIRKYREIRMDKKDKISVILPVFNGEKHIENCLESLICQSYDNLEIIIVMMVQLIIAKSV